MCEGDFEPIELRTISGKLTTAEHCLQCGGFWFGREVGERLDPQAVAAYDIEQPNYSLKSDDLLCPLDRTLLDRTETNDLPSGAKLWHCPDCEGAFYPRGQLAFIFNHHAKNDQGAHDANLNTRSRAAVGVSLASVLVVSLLASVNNAAVQYSAADGSPLPTSGPNAFTLLLLALAYLAGTVLAVLGRRLTIIVLGWGVISLCLLGFAVVIFGP